MQFNMDYDIASLFFLILLFFYYLLKKKNNRGLREKIFIVFIVFLFVLTILDIASSYMSMHYDAFDQTLNEIVNTLFLTCQTGSSVLYYTYGSLLVSKDGTLPKHFLYAMIPVGILALMILTNFLHHQFFFFQDGLYMHGPLHFLIYVEAVVYMVIAILVIVLHERGKKRRYTKYALIVALVSGICMAVQAIHPYILLITYASTISLWIMYVSFESYNIEYDSLTKTYNRLSFSDQVSRLLKRNRNGRYAIVSINIRGFKVYNELFGVAIGDKILIQVGEALQNIVKDEGVVARYDNDNFVVCIPTSILKDDLNILSKEDVKIEEINNSINYSVGIYEMQVEDQTDVELMVDHANLALQSIHHDATKTVAYYNYEMSRHMLAVQQLVVDFDDAIANNQFEVYIQPIYDGKTNKLAGGEVLSRWNHPFFGLLSPGAFMKTLESHNLLARLDWYVWEKACDIINDFEHNGELITLSVNISRIHFYDAKFKEKLDALLERKHVEKGKFKIEITEQVYSEEDKTIHSAISALQKSGYTIMMDDFGSGYSSLNMLKDADVDIVKIDLLFLSNIQNIKTKVILESVISMIHNLQLKALIEGVETVDQYNLIKDLDIELIQGYLFAKPLPLVKYAELVKEDKKVIPE